MIEVLLKNQTFKSLKTSTTSYNVTGLGEFTNYTFAVSAVNQIGKGPPITIFEQTLPDSKFKIHS